ncbi:MAG: DUF5689 domain-containing protein [Rikenellaceae bacterium]
MLRIVCSIRGALASATKISVVAIVTLAVCVVVCGCSPTNMKSLTSDSNDSQNDDNDTGGSEGSYDTDGDTFLGDVTPILTLRSLYVGAATLVTGDVIIEGYVVANDALGEFPKSLVLQDASGGVAIECDMSNLYKSYPVGAYLRVACSGLWIGSAGGCIYIGGAKSEEYTVERLSEDQISMHLTVDITKYQQVVATEVTCDQLSDNLLQCYVRMCNLRFRDATIATTYCEFDPDTDEPISTTHILEDMNGNTIELYVKGDADYAAMAVPLNYVTVEAILERYGSSYSLRVINASII